MATPLECEISIEIFSGAYTTTLNLKAASKRWIDDITLLT